MDNDTFGREIWSKLTPAMKQEVANEKPAFAKPYNQYTKYPSEFISVYWNRKWSYTDDVVNRLEQDMEITKQDFIAAGGSVNPDGSVNTGGSTPAPPTNPPVPPTNNPATPITNGTLLQIGANSGQSLSININSMTSTDLGIADIDITVSSTMAGNDSVISKIDTAINIVSSERARLGAMQNRLEYTIKNVENSAENLQSAESKIRDTDMAKTMMGLTSKNILVQTSQAMLIQANQQPEQALSLLK